MALTLNRSDMRRLIALIALNPTNCFASLLLKPNLDTKTQEQCLRQKIENISLL